MSDVKRLLDEATPLPWRKMAQGNSLTRDGTIVAQARLEGPRGTYNPEWVGWDEITRGHTEAARWTPTLHADDVALIVYVVNHLPDYEALVEAVVAYTTAEDECNRVAEAGTDAEWLAASQAEKREGDNLRAVLRRLRETVPT